MSFDLQVEVVPVSEAFSAEINNPETEMLPVPANQPPVVLIVDDEKLIADTLAAILSRAGLTTLTAYDGASALALARDNSPEVLVTDVAMPGMDGIELAIALKTCSPTCKVLLFSGHANSAHLVQARSAGHDFPLIAKPIHPTDMVRRVTQALSDRMAELDAKRTPARKMVEEPVSVATSVIATGLLLAAIA
jgi:DNA-binding NtrC family response regulator